MHAHYVAPDTIAEAARNGHQYGVTIASDSDGRHYLTFDNGTRLRPFLDELCSLEKRLPTLDASGVSLQIVSPWTDMAGDDLPVHQAVRWARLQNDTTAADVRAAGGRFEAMGILPMQDATAALAELDHVVHVLGMRAVEIGTSVDGRGLDDPALFPVWKRICDLDVLVLLHPPLKPVGLDRVGDYFLNNLISYPTDTTIAAARLIFCGLLDRLPGLKICLAHGGGFLPYQIGRLDRGFQAHPACRRALDHPPSDFIGRFYYDSLTHDDAALGFLVERAGAAQVLYGSDYPFEMLDPTGPERIRRISSLSPTATADILADNFRRLLPTTAPRPQGA
jgi:aminocarboxymuconate-semialdehyde decarboxylase